MSFLQNRLSAALAAVLGLSITLCAPNCRAGVETGGVYDQWGVWSCWYWPFNDTLSPNLYGDDEALSRYDAFTGAASRAWEYEHHGPPRNQPDWAGHCHAWCGASVWEYMPISSRILGSVTFRPRDLAALMTEAYYQDTQATELSVYRPSPGLLWRYLRQEILGQDAMHGHAMALVGNLTPQRGEVWNYPIYQYSVNYTQDVSGATCSGTVTLWYADDSSPAYADALQLSAASVSYQFQAVSLDADLVPLDSGSWTGNDPSLYPTAIWRPYCASSWTNYAANPELDAVSLAQILDVLSLGDALDAPALKWVTTGDAIWQAISVASFDASASAESGRLGDNQLSRLQTTVTGPGTVSFRWKVSSETGYDFMRFAVDGQEQPGSISGEVDWQQRSFVISGAGAHILEWIYAKDDSASGGYDRAWLDQVSWASALLAGAPVLLTTRAGDQLVVCWGTNWAHYQLECSTSATPAQTWSPVATAPTIAGGMCWVTNSPGPACRLYRLRLP